MKIELVVGAFFALAFFFSPASAGDPLLCDVVVEAPQPPLLCCLPENFLISNQTVPIQGGFYGDECANTNNVVLIISSFASECVGVS